MSETSTKPYLLRAIYEWCTDNGYTPYLAAMVDERTLVPREFVKDGEIVLNISFTATSGLKMENEWIYFSARFGGVARDISVPVDNVVAIYARENGKGMAFEVTKPAPAGKNPAEGLKLTPPGFTLASVPSIPADSSVTSTTDDENNDPDPPKKGGKPTLTRIK